MTQKKNPFLGKWRITEMEEWDKDFIDAEEEGYIEFGKGGQGDFQFGYVHGFIDYNVETEAGKQRLDFSWEGSNEMDEAAGRGWVRMEDDGTLYGKITFHMGERSWFRAKKI
jgi:hypothetical protein